VSSEPVGTDVPAEASGSEPTPAPGRRAWRRWVGLIALVIVIDVAALIAFPPFPKGGQPGQDCSFPACFITSTLEFPAPHTVINLAPNNPAPPPVGVYFQPSLSSTLLTMWLVVAIVVIGSVLLIRGSKLIPGRGQNLFEFVYEFLSDFGLGLAGPSARPYIPIFLGAFLLVLFDNWIGLVPPVGRVDFLRAPSSDVNITIGMALVSFLIFEIEGFRRLGVGGYLGKFFPFYEFRNGIGAGIIALFVGLIELMLEFVKPVTLSMRLFGNIYGGEVALGVITSLTIAIFPIALILLDGLLNAIQALIFSVLTLVFITLAIESHDEEEGHIGEEVVDVVEGRAPPALQPSH
jgi:F-type H+-transporting ATPase subunit a